MFVSQLSGLILENTISSIRVNKIEVSGLGDDLYLIVERSPRIDYFVRGAPRLIVEWVSKMSDVAESEFCGMLLEKFRQG